jgi:ABC-type uncharacterized transport system auxiliary subunit
MRSAFALAVALPLILCGCRSSIPPTHFYILEPQDLPRVEAFGTGLAIGVEPFQVDPPYDQDRIVYRIGEQSVEVGFYAYHRWAAPLGRMLPSVVASSFRGVPGTRSIEPIAVGRGYDAFMSGRVLAFEEIDTPAGPRARVRMTLALHGNDGTELWSATLSRDADVSSKDVADVVDRMRSALAKAIHDSRPSLRSALQTQD